MSALAIELGHRFGVKPAVVIGRVAAARVTIFDGHVGEGLDLLDEVAILLMSGEVDPLTTGMMYCELICAAQGLALHDRASEWTQVMERWRHGAAFGGINGRCRVHRAELLRISGPCDLAEEEALRACEELRPWMRREFGWPLAELGNIRLRRGDLAGAEEAFLAAHKHAWSPHPGLALLRLEQGDNMAATALIADAIAHPFNVPSKERPPFGDLRLAPLLDAQCEIAAAAGEVATARQTADVLQLIADAYPTSSLEAGAVLARARAALTGGDLGQAIDLSLSAITAWTDIGAPFEVAAARMVLAQAHRICGDLERARMEWQAARTSFSAFGATRWAERAERLLADAPPSPPASPSTEAATGTFKSDGDTRTIRYGGRTVLMRDLKGFRYVQRLLADPVREFHVLDLVAVECGWLPTGGAVGEDLTVSAERTGTGLPVFDDKGRDAYRRRLADVDDDIEEATAWASATRRFIPPESLRIFLPATGERSTSSITRPTSTWRFRRSSCSFRMAT